MTSLLLAALLAAPAREAPAARTSPDDPSTVRIEAVGPPAATAEPVAVARAEDARRLCEALAPAERPYFTGSAMERGDAEADRAARREQALAGRYRVRIPAERLRFAPYSAEERVLSLYRHTLPATGDGAVRLHPVVDPGLPVEADAARVRRILEAHKGKKLALDVTFVLPEDDDAPCFHVPGTSSWTFAAEPVAWAYVADGAVIARGGAGADRPLVSAREGAKPRVQVGTAGEDETERRLRVAAVDRVADVQACYARALDRDPWLDGTLVVGVERGDVRIAADSVQDPQLATCVRDVLAKAQVRGGADGAYLPIHFALDPPGTGSASN